jgi:hypothetical protein
MEILICTKTWSMPLNLITSYDHCTNSRWRLVAILTFPHSQSLAIVRQAKQVMTSTRIQESDWRPS